MMDSRAGRVLEPGARAMVDAEEWDCIERVDARRLRPPAAGHLAAGLPRARDALPRGLERGRLPTARGARWPRPRPSACARASTSSTGPRSATRCAPSSGCSRSDRLRARRRRRRRGASCCSRATSTTPTSPQARLGRRAAGDGRPGLPGGVLAAAQSAGLAREARDQVGMTQRRRARRARAGARRGRGERTADLGDRRGPVVRQPGGHARPRRTKRCTFRLDKALGAGDGAAAARTGGRAPPRLTRQRRGMLAGRRSHGPRGGHHHRRTGPARAGASAAHPRAGRRARARPAGRGDAAARPGARGPLRQPRRAARRPRAGRLHRDHEGDRRLRPHARGALLLLRDADGARRDQAPLPRQDVGHARPARPAGAAAARGQGARQAHPRARAARRPSRRSPTPSRRRSRRSWPRSRASARGARARSTSRRARTSRWPTRSAPSTPRSSAPRCARCSTAPSTCSQSRDQEVLRLRFEHDLTQTEIAQRIGVSQMQVSRLIRQSLARMRMDIERSPERRSRIA